MSDWHLYMIRCRDGSLYTGITLDVERRLAEHQSGRAKAAKYLRGRGPLELVYSVKVGEKSRALSLEHWVKSLSRNRKDHLLAGTIPWPDTVLS